MLPFEVYLHLEGGALQFLCAVDGPEALASVIQALTAVAKPGYATIEIRILPKEQLKG